MKDLSFRSKLGFIATAASSAVGVGNIWRFPYLTGKYGGASFIVMYVVCIFLLGFPLVLAKLAFGRSMRSGTYNAYKKFTPPGWRMIGFGAALTSFLMLSYYIVITSWLIGYGWKISFGGLLYENNFSNYFINFVAGAKENFFFCLITVSIIVIVVYKGINEGIERLSRILMPLFIIMMIILIIYSFSLKGSSKGLVFYLFPNTNAFTREAFFAALTQSFMSLSIGLGISITYGAYVDKKDNLIKSTAIIVLSDTIVSLLAGLIIFPIIFQANIEPNQGTGLIFISLPLAFKHLGFFIGRIVGSIFFVLLIFAALTSAIALLEVSVKYMIERFKILRSKSVFILGIILFVLSIPSILSNGNNQFFTHFLYFSGKKNSFLDTMDLFCADIFAPMVATFFSIFIFKKWKIKTLYNEINLNPKKYFWLSNYLSFTIKYICPIGVSCIVLVKIYSIFF